MKVEYHNTKNTDVNRLWWSREAWSDGHFVWFEMWCRECDDWRQVEHVGSERHCKVCSDAQQLKMDAEYEAWVPPELSTKPLEWFPAICGCGTVYESTSPGIQKCDKCYALSQETEGALRGG